MTAGTPRLSEVARHVIQPEGIVGTQWHDVSATCHRLGFGFDRWQDGAGRLVLATRKDGLYAADTVVISIPRQVGKTYLMGAIIFALCLLHPGLTVIWTAHRVKTARETYQSMKSMAERPKVAQHIERVVAARGDEAVEFINGSRILFGSRERGFGRGFAEVDVLMLDEAQILGENAMDDMVPATNASRNPLILMTGTPPKPSDDGEIFTMLRQEALDGESDALLYIELSADRDADPTDRDQWRKANPSFPHRTSERAMLRMRKNLSESSFVREALGIWDEFSRHQAVVKPTEWSALSDVGPPDGTKPSGFGLDASHDRQFSVSACWQEGESVHGEEVWAGVDDAACIDWLAERASRRIIVAVDAQSPAASLVPALRARKVKVNVTTAADMSKACGMWLADTKGRRLTHADQEAVNDALAGAKKRPIGDAGGWGWDRKDGTSNISPIVSFTLARYIASLTTKKSSGTGRREAVVL